jgi:hypothetical protein
MEKKTFTFDGVTFSYRDNMPDGDYTIGRGADPRGKTRTVTASAKSLKSTKPLASKQSTKSLWKLKATSTPNLQRRRKIVGA